MQLSLEMSSYNKQGRYEAILSGVGQRFYFVSPIFCYCRNSFHSFHVQQEPTDSRCHSEVQGDDPKILMDLWLWYSYSCSFSFSYFLFFFSVGRAVRPLFSSKQELFRSFLRADFFFS
jgi:hypothetical protein